MMQKIPWTYKTPKPVILDSDVLAGYFARILRKGEDFAVTVYGNKRTGKSITTAELIRLIAEINKKPFSIKNDIVFYLKDFYELMQRADRLTGKMLDDFGSEADSKRSMEQSSIDLTHFFHTSGTEGVGYFITTPTSGWINKDIRERVANYFIWIIRKNDNPRFVTAKVFYLQKNETKKKVYMHNLSLSPSGRVNNKGIGNPITEWTLYPLPKELEEEYYPYRLEKANRNLEKGLSNLKEKEEREKPQEFNPSSIANQIVKEWDKYFNVPFGKKNKVLDAGLIKDDFKLTDRKYAQVKSRINQIKSSE